MKNTCENCSHFFEDVCEVYDKEIESKPEDCASFEELPIYLRELPKVAVPVESRIHDISGIINTLEEELGRLNRMKDFYESLNRELDETETWAYRSITTTGITRVEKLIKENEEKVSSLLRGENIT